MTHLKSTLDAVSAKRTAHIAAFQKRPSGLEWCEGLTEIADSVVRAIFAPFEGLPLAVVATGGYGRKELAPGSDIDLTFIPLDEHDGSVDDKVRALFRQLVDTFGALDWQVGYAYRLRSDCIALDEKTRTGLLDARLICGPKTALDEFCAEYERTFPIADFLIAKLDERVAMSSRWNDTPRASELHIKEGSGGLRDYQTAQWFSRVLDFPDTAAPANSYDYLLALRNALHLATRRKEDRFLSTRRTESAQLLGIDVVDLERRTIEAAEAVSNHWKNCRAKAVHSSYPLGAGARCDDGKCVVAPDATFSEACSGIARAVALSVEVADCSGERAIGDGPSVIQELTSSAEVLRKLDEVGVLASAIPEYEMCVHLLSPDPMHAFSVGEHSLRAVEHLHASRSEAEFAEAWAEVGNPRPMTFAMFIHDFGKALPGHHSETGAEIGAQLCRRFGLGTNESETTAWLVREHLVFAQTARTHDLGHPETAIQLAEKVGRQDRLAMLFLLTVADIRAVNDTVWTPQLASACHELYRKTRAAIGQEAAPSDPALYRSEAVRRASGAAGDDVLQLMPTHYLFATPASLFTLHADYIRRARSGEVVVEFQTQSDMRTTDITICMRDLPEPGLLSRVLGVVYAFDLTVHATRAAGTRESDSIALDVITVSYRGESMPMTLSGYVAAELRLCLQDEAALQALLVKHGKDPLRKQDVLTFKFRESELGILDVETPLGRGMPYRVARMLAGFGWNIHVARIGQWAGRAVARFYLDTPEGKLTEQEVSRAMESVQA